MISIDDPGPLGRDLKNDSLCFDVASKGLPGVFLCELFKLLVCGGASDRSGHDSSRFHIMVWVVAVPQQYRYIWLARNVVEFGSPYLSVDEEMFVIAIDPHDRGLGLALWS